MAYLFIQIFVFLSGLGLVTLALKSAIRSFVLPRGSRDPLGRFVFVSMRRLFNFVLRFTTTYEQKDRIMAYYAPVSLLSLLPVWLLLVFVGFGLMFWALPPAQESFALSGSSLFTLGFSKEIEPWNLIFIFAEATIGLILVALLMAFLPTMYSAFQYREKMVTMLEVRAGSPPTAVELISRMHRVNKLENLPGFWEQWEEWFAQITESHTTLPALIFFRSPFPYQSWITAAGALLDTAALLVSTIDIPRNPQTAMCIRSGFVAFRRLADFFDHPYNPNPQFPEVPISIRQAEFEAVYDRLAAEGVPLKPDREQAWQAFAGWRVNYDELLLYLCTITMAPEAPWSSDRAPDFASRAAFPVAQAEAE